jgi:hypothetical protein
VEKTALESSKSIQIQNDLEKTALERAQNQFEFSQSALEKTAFER